MFGNGFYNPYMYQPYYQTANMARNLGGLASTGARNSLGNAFGRTLGNSIGNTLANGASSGGLGGLLSKFSFSGFLNGASKTLNVINQAIPIFYQVRPMINNAKTMFRIMGAVKDDDSKEEKQNTKISNTSSTSTMKQTIQTSTNDPVKNNKLNPEMDNENPVFFI